MTVKEGSKPDTANINPLPDAISPLPKVIFTDVDDTLTYEGLLPVETFIALYSLHQAGFTVIPVTGASRQ